MTDLKLYGKVIGPQTASQFSLFSELLRKQEETNMVKTDHFIENLANRVLKFLLTEKGSDPLDKEYGSEFITYKNISPELLGLLRVELENDLVNCVNYFKKLKIKNQSTNELDGLKRIELIDIKYDRNNDPTRFDIYLRIYTDKGIVSLINIDGYYNLNILDLVYNNRRF